ncbi:MAG: glycoside hydrolase family 13 protein [Phycisphaerales bacterium]|nr:glycoside hydrolase family 13 protein [Phycisphaerales bacterium]
MRTKSRRNLHRRIDSALTERFETRHEKSCAIHPCKRIARSAIFSVFMQTPIQVDARPRFARRDQDWRVGAVVYQVFVDRFAPAANLAQKTHHYAAPRTLRAWSELPSRGHFIAEHSVWSQELDFWGGDLESVRTHLRHVQSMHADVLYLNPIQHAFTNHKYDATDYLEISAEYGTRDDLRALAAEVHALGMHIILDGVFNHIGRRNAFFIDANSNPQSPYRDWFFIGPQYQHGYRGWADVANLPDLRLENEAVRAFLWLDPSSVVRSYLRDGIDGWRLDVASDLGPVFLRELTKSAHAEKPHSAIVGEIWNTPAGWEGTLDGILNMHARLTILNYCSARADARTTSEHFADMIEDAGIEFALRCWTTLENHDTERLAHRIPDARARSIGHLLQATLPGCPNLYYGQEVGMQGGADPENRAPMRWDLCHDGNDELRGMRALYAARRTHRALSKGDVIFLRSQHLVAFLRTTDVALEICLVVTNMLDVDVEESIAIRDGRIMAGTVFRDALASSDDAHAHTIRVEMGYAAVRMNAKSARVFCIVPPPEGQHSPYKRMH